MELIVGVSSSPQFPGRIPQRQDFQIAQIIFQIIAGFQRYLGVDGQDGSLVGDTEAFQDMGYFAVRGIIIVDHNVQHRIEA